MHHYAARSLRLLASLCFVAALAACGGTSATLTGPRQPSRPADCEFRVLTALPGPGYVELGTIDVQPGGYGVNTFTSLDGFKRRIQPYVCDAGGDAALAQANGYGMYIKATILKSTGQAPGAAAPVSPSNGGCQFDTQCKGDRVCVQGACVDPVKRTP